MFLEKLWLRIKGEFLLLKEKEKKHPGLLEKDTGPSPQFQDLPLGQAEALKLGHRPTEPFPERERQSKVQEPVPFPRHRSLGGIEVPLPGAEDSPSGVNLESPDDTNDPSSRRVLG